MPVATESTHQRREAILEIIQAQDILRQSELVKLLAQRGIQATQSSVSRDLRQLGITKLDNGYRQALSDATHRDKEPAIQGSFSSDHFVRGVDTAGINLTVIKTAVGAAQRVAVFLDRSGWPEIVGTLSGDDTIFVATRNGSDQRSLVAKIQVHFSD